MAFISPGRHAGPGGDIETILAAAKNEHPGLRTHMTKLLGDNIAVVQVLEDRYRLGAQMLASMSEDRR